MRILPRIVSFSPTSGGAGTPVQVRGTGFLGAIKPKFTIGGSAAVLERVDWEWNAEYTAPIGFAATISVPSGASSGKIGVGTNVGSTLSAGTFTVTP